MRMQAHFVINGIQSYFICLSNIQLHILRIKKKILLCVYNSIKLLYLLLLRDTPQSPTNHIV